MARSILNQCEQLLLGNDAFLDRRMQHENKSHEQAGRNLARIKSMREFANHRSDDIRREVALLHAFLSEKRSINLQHFLPQMLLFEGEEGENREGGSRAPLAERLTHSLRTSAGLDQVARTPAEIAAVTNVFKEAVQDDERIDFSRLVGTGRRGEPAQHQQQHQQHVFTNLEVCAGAGDWATSQASEGDRSSNDPCLWITLELRRDRVQQTFSTMLLKGVKNMCVVGGDAHRVMERHFLQESVDNIFINHPEPPERNSGTGGSGGVHLLTSEFFKVMRGVLRPGGRITIVTDNLPYGKSLIGIVYDLKNGSGSSNGGGGGRGESAAGDGADDAVGARSNSANHEK